VLLLTGCGGSGPVEIDSPDLSARERTACESLVASLPERVAAESSRAVTPKGALGAAWGDPAITLTCGVGVPAGFDRLSGCTQVDGVGWFVPEGATSGEEDATFTAVGYRPRVALHVPSDYLPEGGAAALAELAAPVREHLRLVDRCE
jgi:hypothetical protein